jgi:tetratricopeptide (TPR) repeat protein
MRRALAIAEGSYGADHPVVAIRLNNLAPLLQDTNRLAAAEPLMRRALAIAEGSYGADHPVVAIRLNNLAALLQATNRLAEAEPLMRRALAIDEGSYGADHPEVATDLNNLAALLQATNRLAEAEPLYQRGVRILIAFRRRTGHEHPHFRVVQANHVGALQAMGKTPDQVRQHLDTLNDPPRSEGP